MTTEMIKEDLLSSLSCQVFDYKGKPCDIDPAGNTYIVWYGEKDFVAKNLDEVFTTKFFDGKSLDEIVDEIENYGLG